MKTKILILVALFSLQATLYLVNAVTGYFSGVTYGVFGNAFVYAGIMGFIAWALYSRRDKWTYFAAAFFSGLTLIRSILGFGLTFYSGTGLSTSFALLAVVNAVIFGIIPLLLLWNKEVRIVFHPVQK